MKATELVVALEKHLTPFHAEIMGISSDISIQDSSAVEFVRVQIGVVDMTHDRRDQVLTVLTEFDSDEWRMGDPCSHDFGASVMFRSETSL